MRYLGTGGIQKDTLMTRLEEFTSRSHYMEQLIVPPPRDVGSPRGHTYFPHTAEVSQIATMIGVKRMTRAGHTMILADHAALPTQGRVYALAHSQACV